MKEIVTGLGVSVAIGFGAVLVLIWLTQRSLIYFPARDTPMPAAYGLPRAEVVPVTTDDGFAHLRRRQRQRAA